MKRALTRILSKIAAVLAIGGMTVCAHAQNLVGNGDFSFNPIGTTASATNALYTATAFSYWWLYSVNSTNGASLTATIVTNPASPGNLALRLDYKRVGPKNSAGSEDWGFLKRPYMPVVFGKSYYLSFDAASVGNATILKVIFPEFQTSGVFSGNQYSKNVTVNTPEYQRYVIAWTPTREVTSQANVHFMPQLSGLGSDTNSSLLIDNVELVEAGYGLNAGFEAEPVGTTATKSGAGDQKDSTTFSNWEIHAQNATNGTCFAGTVMANPATGGKAIRLDYNAAAGCPATWTAFSRYAAGMTLTPLKSYIAVIPGERYYVTFDAAYVSGSSQIRLVMTEYNAAGSFNNNEASLYPSITNTNLTRFTYLWTPLTSTTTQVCPNFRVTDRTQSISILLDNCQLTRESPVLGYGSFEGQAAGTTAAITNKTPKMDTTTISGWYVYSDWVSSSSYADDWIAALMTNSSAGNVALKLDWVSNGGRDTVLQANNFTPVTNGVFYNLMFDMAYVSGSGKINLRMTEYATNKTFVGEQVYDFVATNTAYQTFTITNWTPKSPTYGGLKPAFRPQAVGTTSDSVVLLDNIRFAPTANAALSGLTLTYNGLAQAATVTTVPTGLPVTVTYNGLLYPPLNAGAYAVTASVSDLSYLSVPVTNTLVIGKAGATVTLGDLSQRYNRAPRAVSVAVTPPNLAVDVTYNGSPDAPTAVGRYQVVATVNDTNYVGSVTNTFVITAIPSTVVLLR